MYSVPLLVGNVPPAIVSRGCNSGASPSSSSMKNKQGRDSNRRIYFTMH